MLHVSELVCKNVSLTWRVHISIVDGEDLAYPAEENCPPSACASIMHLLCRCASFGGPKYKAAPELQYMSLQRHIKLLQSCTHVYTTHYKLGGQACTQSGMSQV